MAPMATETQMTSLNFWITGTVKRQLSPKFPVSMLPIWMKYPGTIPLSNPYWALSCSTHSS